MANPTLNATGFLTFRRERSLSRLLSSFLIYSFVSACFSPSVYALKTQSYQEGAGVEQIQDRLKRPQFLVKLNTPFYIQPTPDVQGKLRLTFERKKRPALFIETGRSRYTPLDKGVARGITSDPGRFFGWIGAQQDSPSERLEFSLSLAEPREIYFFSDEQLKAMRNLEIRNVKLEELARRAEFRLYVRGEKLPGPAGSTYFAFDIIITDPNSELYHERFRVAYTDVEVKHGDTLSIVKKEPARSAGSATAASGLGQISAPRRAADELQAAGMEDPSGPAQQAPVVPNEPVPARLLKHVVVVGTDIMQINRLGSALQNARPGLQVHPLYDLSQIEGLPGMLGNVYAPQALFIANNALIPLDRGVAEAKHHFQKANRPAVLVDGYSIASAAAAAAEIEQQLSAGTEEKAFSFELPMFNGFSLVDEETNIHVKVLATFRGNHVAYEKGLSVAGTILTISILSPVGVFRGGYLHREFKQGGGVRLRHLAQDVLTGRWTNKAVDVALRSRQGAQNVFLLSRSSNRELLKKPNLTPESFQKQAEIVLNIQPAKQRDSKVSFSLQVPAGKSLFINEKEVSPDQVNLIPDRAQISVGNVLSKPAEEAAPAQLSSQSITTPAGLEAKAEGTEELLGIIAGHVEKGARSVELSIDNKPHGSFELEPNDFKNRTPDFLKLKQALAHFGALTQGTRSLNRAGEFLQVSLYTPTDQPRPAAAGNEDRTTAPERPGLLLVGATDAAYRRLWERVGNRSGWLVEYVNDFPMILGNISALVIDAGRISEDALEEYLKSTVNPPGNSRTIPVVIMNSPTAAAQSRPSAFIPDRVHRLVGKHGVTKVEAGLPGRSNIRLLLNDLSRELAVSTQAPAAGVEQKYPEAGFMVVSLHPGVGLSIKQEGGVNLRQVVSNIDDALRLARAGFEESALVGVLTTGMEESDYRNYLPGMRTFIRLDNLRNYERKVSEEARFRFAALGIPVQVVSGLSDLAAGLGQLGVPESQIHRIAAGLEGALRFLNEV